jgi:hypothetical protein
MTDESAAEPFNLDNALESVMEKMDHPEKEAEPEVAEVSEKPIEIAEEKAEEKSDQGSEPESEPAKEQPLTAPDRWSAERKAVFAALPRDAQQMLLERESETDKAFTQKTQELAEQRKQYEALEQILAPRRQALASAYGSEAGALAELFRLSDYANSDPAGFVQWFAQGRGLNLQQLTPPAATSDEYVDPATQRLTLELNTIKQKLTAQEQAQVAARQESVRNEISALKEENDESGQLLRPHFDAVKTEMASLMQSGAAKTLDHAYKMAIWANEGVRSKILEEQKKAEETKRIEAAKQAASKAEKAKGVTVKSKKGGESSPSKRGSWEDTLSDKAEELYGAA